MIAIIYTFHEYTDNVEFFIKHGLFKSTDVHFYLVINSTDVIINLKQDNVMSVNRSNFGHDFGAWSHCLFKTTAIDNSTPVYQRYDHYIFINSSVKGPFLPVWYKEQDWTKLFISEINGTVKLFGTTIGNYDNIPHVQSMVLVTDRVGLQIGIDNNIFDREPRSMERWDVIVQKELGYSKAILQRGYNIGCLLSAFRNIDFRTAKPFRSDLNVFGHDDYYGIEVHPFEVIFLKVPKFGHDYLFKTLSQYSQWNKIHVTEKKAISGGATVMNGATATGGAIAVATAATNATAATISTTTKSTMTTPEVFDWREYLKLHHDVFWTDNSERFANYHYDNFGRSEHRKLIASELKYWELYAALNSDILHTHREKKTITDHYILHGKSENRITAIANFEPDKFHWVHYKFTNNIADIITKIQAMYHYIKIGHDLNLEYYPIKIKKAYLIDLNPLSTSGLFNQIISLINGILLAWCCNRDLYVTGFYPDYNQQKRIAVKDVIDITHLNNMLNIQGINVVVSEDYKNKNWKKSILMNPTKVDFNDPKYNYLRGTLDSEPLWEKKLILIMKHIFHEPDDFVNIGDVFDWFLFRENTDESLRLLFKYLMINMKYNSKMYDVCNYCIDKLKLSNNFGSIHLRLEDDILFHRPDKTVPEHTYGEDIKNKYLNLIPKRFNSADTIYLSTFLLKAPNKYNYFPMILRTSFPNVKFWQRPNFYWRNEYKGFIEGREIDGLIDYLICLKSQKFIGFNGSTFSEIIKYYLEFHGKSVDLI